MADHLERGSTWTNWGRNQSARPTEVARPASVDDVVALVNKARAAGRRIKAVGSGHSFSAIAVAPDLCLDPSALSRLLSADQTTGLVRVQPGMSLRSLNGALAAHGLALPNLGDVAEQTIAGAISTGTHGTGTGYGCLSTFVDEITMVTGSGDVLTCSTAAQPDVFAAARVGLGALGVITEMTLRCGDAFVLRAEEGRMPLATVLAGLDTFVSESEHFEFYWQPYTSTALTKRNNRTLTNDRPLSRIGGWWDDEFLQNTVCRALRWVGHRAPALATTTSRAEARVFSRRTYTGRSDRVFTTPRRVRFVEMEYSLPRAVLTEAFGAVRRIVDGLSDRVLMPIEVRFTAADDIWLSPGYRRDCIYIAIHQYAGAPYETYFRAFEEACVDLGGRPHWGKLHWRDAVSLREVYPRFDDFAAIRDRLDPDRVFANDYLNRVLGD